MSAEDAEFRDEVITRLTRIESKQEAFLHRLEVTEKEIPPLRKHVNMMGGALALIVTLGASAAAFDRVQHLFRAESGPLRESSPAVLHVSPGSSSTKSALNVVESR